MTDGGYEWPSERSKLTSANTDNVLLLQIREQELKIAALQQEVEKWKRRAGGITSEEWNQLEAENATLRARVEQQEGQLREWLKQNGPGGWIDDLRKTVERQQRAVTDEERVKIYFPDASCAGPMRYGKPHPDGGYLILVGSASAPLASGPSKLFAWTNAWEKLASRAGEPQGEDV